MTTMNPEVTLDHAAGLLTRWMANCPDEVQVQKAALDRYHKLFSPANLATLTQENFKNFLVFKNNRHWNGINRQPGIYADMERLRACLGILLDESIPIASRLDAILPKSGEPFIKGLSRAVLTPILMCAYPDRYAVYNRISEEALTRMGRVALKASDPFSTRYVALNDACRQIATEIRQPLYLVDSMFSLLMHGAESPLVITVAKPDGRVPPDNSEEVGPLPMQDERLLFPMERFLQEFIVSNWQKTALGHALNLHSEDGEEATEYPTDVGRIDILARDKKDDAWVVIELKKERDSDRVVGQLLRYMGWVKRHKATNGQDVRGIIITNVPDERIQYAVSVTQGIAFYTYRVSFDLQEQRMV